MGQRDFRVLTVHAQFWIPLSPYPFLASPPLLSADAIILMFFATKPEVPPESTLLFKPDNFINCPHTDAL